MSYIKIHQDRIADKEAATGLCPFGAILTGAAGELEIGAGCRMCRACIRSGGGAFEFIDDSESAADLSEWRGIAVVAEISPSGELHPVSLELLGKARELAAKSGQKVLSVAIGAKTSAAAGRLLAHGADAVYAYEDPAFAHFRIEPYANALSDFIEEARPSAVLVGGTPDGRSLAPRVAARFRTGLTADCTMLDMSPSGDLDQIRPAYGGNIMAHINTPRHRPQFATVRYKVFSPPPPQAPHGRVVARTLPPEKLASKIEIVSSTPRGAARGIEEAETLVVCGRGVKRREDVAMLQELAALLGGEIAATRAVVEAGWFDAKRQIGLSGRTVKPKLLIACGVSGAIQFVAGMQNAETIVAINTDANAPVFKVAHVALAGDLYAIVPELIRCIKAKKEAK